MKYHEEFFPLQPTFPPKPFDNFSPEYGCSDGLDSFKFSLEHSLSFFSLEF